MSPPREFTDVEISQLSSNGITSLTALWEQVGNDFDRGLPIVHTATGVAVSRLREVLASKGGRDFEIVGESLGKPQGAWGRQTRQAVKRYWLEIIGAVFLLFIIFLVLRATGLTQRWPAPFGIRERVVVAARRLEAGSVIRDGDLFAARLPSGEGYFHDTGELSGLILAQPVREMTPLHFKDVTRLQVVAKSGIPSGKAISADDIALDWTPYQRGAFENEEPVKGKVATKAIRAGDVILGDFIAGSGQVSTGK